MTGKVLAAAAVALVAAAVVHMLPDVKRYFEMRNL